MSNAIYPNRAEGVDQLSSNQKVCNSIPISYIGQDTEPQLVSDGCADIVRRLDIRK